MKLLLCLSIALAIGQMEAKSFYHSSLEAEYECLTELNLNMKDVLPYVHVETDPSDKEGIGEYLVCVWKKKGIMGNGGTINVKNIVKYLSDIYHPNEEQAQEIEEAVAECGNLHAEKESTLAILIKNCMVRASKDYGKPKEDNI